MGILRLLLALSVVIMHCGEDFSTSFLVGGRIAVKLFFVISGFYMALILTEKYVGPKSAGLFYGNRLLRLLPAYYVVLLATLILPWICSAMAGRPVTFGALAMWKTLGERLPESWNLALKLLHLSPLGQEIPTIASLNLTNGQLYTAPVRDGDLELFNFMLIPPAWSISVELQFYLVAPFLVRLSPLPLLLLGAVTLALRWLLLLLPFGNEVFWIDRLALTSIGFFILGILAYKLRQWVAGSPKLSGLRAQGMAFLLFAIAILVVFPWLPGQFREPLVTLAFAGCLPFVFERTAAISWDQTLGNLSYPLYLIHWLVKDAWYGFAAHMPQLQLSKTLNALAVVTLSIGAAYVIHRWVERPVDRWRQRRVALRINIPGRQAPSDRSAT